MAVQSTAERQLVTPRTRRNAGATAPGNVLAAVWLWVRWLAILFAVNAGASAILLFSRASGTSSALNELPLDDSWIHLVYIRAIVTEGCLCYNTGVWEAGATSWAWVLLNAPFYLVGVEWLGIDPVFVVKFVGLLTAAVASLFALLLVRRVTGSRNFGLLVVALMAFEPTFAYSRISGMETPVVVAAVLGSTLALVTRRYRLAGMGLAIAFLSRPEASLFVVAALIIVGFGMVYRKRRTLLLLGRNLIELAGAEDIAAEWSDTRRVLRRVTRSRALLWISVPSALSLIAWAGYNRGINGTVYPNTYLAKHDPTLSLFPVANISTVFHWGVAVWQPWFSGWVLPLSAVIYMVGSYFIVRKAGWSAAPLILFPLLLIIAVGKSQAFGEAEFLFWTRRYLDPAAPVIVMVLVLGLWAVLGIARSHINSRFTAPAPRLAALAPVSGIFLVLIVVSLVGSIETWTRLRDDYSWNSRNIDDVDGAAGRWVDQNLPPDSTVFVFDAGAIRYFGNRFTYDAAGLNFHALIGRPHIDQIITERPDALAIWAVPVYETLPLATRQVLFTTPRNTILGGGPVGVYILDWQRDDFVDPATIRLLDFDAPVIDSINLTDKESEQAHNHSMSFVAYAPNAIFELGEVVVQDRGLQHGGTGEVIERFAMAAIENEPLTLALRHITNEQPDFVHPSVFIDGAFAGQIPIQPLDAIAQETAFTIPAELVTSDRVQIEVRWNIFVTEFRWWVIAGAE